MVAYLHDATGGFSWLFLIVSGFALTVALAALLLPAGRHSGVAVAAD